jgi:hypothetical protein
LERELFPEQPKIRERRERPLEEIKKEGIWNNSLSDGLNDFHLDIAEPILIVLISSDGHGFLNRLDIEIDGLVLVYARAIAEILIYLMKRDI